MYKLFTDKSELFECDIKLEGASLSKSSARLVVETSDYSLLFKGEINSNGKCEIPIRKLKGLIDENTTGNISASGNIIGETGSFDNGVILTAPNGSKFRFVVNNSGHLSITGSAI